jgi:protein-ribulosamine 3-kinase
MERLPELFAMLGRIQPSLLHGDLWAGNWDVATSTHRPCLFDPAAYYGHAEADLGLAHMFGGFGASFWEAYFEARPKQPGYERRALLYELHHHLNHLNIFGSGYARGAISLMEQILQP